VRSTQLSPGEVQRRVIRAPGLTALFLIGDDERSRAWLRQRQAALRELQPEGPIRRKVLELDVIEAVIGLGPNLFYGTGLAACIVVARRRKSASRSGRVLLVDGSDLFRKGRNQNTLEPDHVTQLLDAYRTFEDVAGRSRVVSLDEIAEQGGNLNLAGYITRPDDTDIPTVAEATAALKDALEAAWAAEDRLNALLAERGLG